VYTAPKVVDATGYNSIPNIPEIPGASTFKGKIIHHRDFGRSTLLQDCKHIVVLGGAKSAADVVYAAAKVGLQVTWVIRKSGSGPAAYFPPDAPIPYYSNGNAAFHHRFVGSLLACIFAPESWWSTFLYRTFIGRAFVRFVWGTMQGEMYKRADYDRKDGMENGYKNLKPDLGLFWQNDSTGLNPHEDLFDTFATKVRIYRQDVDSIGVESMNLADGTIIETEGIVFATGWQQTTPFLDPSTAYSLGLATELSAADPDEDSKWAALERMADVKVLTRFPLLADPPPHHTSVPRTTPFRLYKAMIPTHDHSVVFLGKMMLANHTYNSELQAIFAVGVLEGTLALPNVQNMEEEIALTRAWQMRRYLGKGYMGNWFYFDIVPYTDALLEELGLRSHRMKGWRDWVKPIVAEDLKGLMAEWKQKVGKSKVD
jgi:dimethylaniline monooxygenase (N-oxide forming)